METETKVDMDKATFIASENADERKSVADLVGLGFFPPRELAKFLPNNPFLSEKGQITANELYEKIMNNGEIVTTKIDSEKFQKQFPELIKGEKFLLHAETGDWVVPEKHILEHCISKQKFNKAMSDFKNEIHKTRPDMSVAKFKIQVYHILGKTLSELK